jgi:FMN phosphatase YigB (HAD superfamily)
VATFVFDLGETLVDETGTWTRHAARLDVPTFTLFALLGASIEHGGDHRQVFDYLGVDRTDYLAGVDARNDPLDTFMADDLYPDAAPTLRALVDQGHTVGLAGNQPLAAEAAMARLALPVAFVASSTG